jgi:hypothetical protein
MNILIKQLVYFIQNNHLIKNKNEHFDENFI